MFRQCSCIDVVCLVQHVPVGRVRCLLAAAYATSSLCHIVCRLYSLISESPEMHDWWRRQDGGGGGKILSSASCLDCRSRGQEGPAYGHLAS